MTLLRSKHSNRYCGPAALALIAGIHVDDSARILRETTGKRAIKSCSVHGLTAGLMRCGYLTFPIARGPMIPRGMRPTLTGFLRDIGGLRETETALVLITGHYVVLRGGMLYDNRNAGGIEIAGSRYSRCRVIQGWRVEREKYR